ncbi:MAG TPA: hypothetical protein VFU21_21730, partial [Kofleriaceae bacterium]|nr:hypothetical protein [Kofleriaceae bacterium]
MRALLLAVLGPLLACGSGGDDDGDGDGAGSADGGPSCDQLRLAPGARYSDEPIRIELPRPRSMPLPAAPARPVRTARPLAAEPRPVGLRILLIAPGEERASYQAAAAALARIGVPHDVLLSADQALDRERLYDESGGCRYGGVILSHGDLMH